MDPAYKLALGSYAHQMAAWPATGRHILAQFDADTVVMYQAYRPKIGNWAAAHGCFGHGFSLDRMSWIKPGFLWMMYRSGWGTKPGQEVVLAIWLQRGAFDAILAAAVPTTYKSDLYTSEAEWQAAAAGSDVLAQWDPDHDPAGVALQRRALQLGLRGQTLAHYARDWIVQVADVTPLVATQRHMLATQGADHVSIPKHTVYTVTDPAVAARLRLT